MIDILTLAPTATQEAVFAFPAITNLRAMRRLCTISRIFLFHLLFSCLYIPFAIAGFNFSWSNPTQCDQFMVNWQGGSRPYYLLVVPVGNNLFLKHACPSNLVAHAVASLTLRHIIIPSPIFHSIRTLDKDHFL